MPSKALNWVLSETGAVLQFGVSVSFIWDAGGTK